MKRGEGRAIGLKNVDKKENDSKQGI